MCSTLLWLTIPDSVTSIRDWAFEGCTGLTSITIPDSVTSIGDYVFKNCTGLTNVTIGNGLTSSLRDGVFKGCTGLKSVTIGSGLTETGASAFWDCSGLESINADENNPNYKSIDGILYSKDGKKLIACPKGKIEGRVIIPDGVESIGDSAFRSCKSLVSVTIPESVKSIGNEVFSYCPKLIEIVNKSNCTFIVGLGTLPDKIHNGESKIINNSGYLFYQYDHDYDNNGYNESCLLGYEGDFTDIYLQGLLIDSEETYKIYEYAFYGRDDITSVGISKNVTSIGERAFSGCTGFKRIDYDGTKAEWANIEKDSSWNENTSEYVVHCTDGDIAKADS